MRRGRLWNCRRRGRLDIGWIPMERGWAGDWARVTSMCSNDCIMTSA